MNQLVWLVMSALVCSLSVAWVVSCRVQELVSRIGQGSCRARGENSNANERNGNWFGANSNCHTRAQNSVRRINVPQWWVEWWRSSRKVAEGGAIAGGRSWTFFRAVTETGQFLRLVRLFHQGGWNGGGGWRSLRKVVEGGGIAVGRSWTFFQAVTETGQFLCLVRLLHFIIHVPHLSSSLYKNKKIKC